MKLVYIHGANASHDSFNYIREHIGGDDMTVDYISQDGFEHNLEAIYQQIKKEKDVFFVAHSLGGVYSLYLANKMPKQVLGAVTLSTPYGGSEIADYAKYFMPFNRLFKDVGSHSNIIKNSFKLKVKHPWCNVVTTVGNAPWIIKQNDGVVSVESMKHRTDMDLVFVECNHYEVVLSAKVVNIIKNRIDSVSK